MPNIKCPAAITCPGGPDSPVSNFSSEAPDQILFGATGYPIWNPDNPIDSIPPNDPGLPPAWFAQGCVGPAYSLLSQDDANAIAERQAFICQHQKRNPEPQLFFNVQQQCTYTCPDGTPFVWTIAAGFVVAGTQAEADAIAHSLACSNAAGHFMCLSAISNTCVDQIYNQTVSVLTGGAVAFPLGFSIASGSLPPGVVLAQSTKQAFISGTPTVPGNYQFTLQAMDANGNIGSKQYTLAVLGISNINSLPQPTIARAFSAQLMAAGGTPPYTFSLVDSLPTGLTVNSSGLISGTASVHYTGNFTSTFKVTDATGMSCTGVWKSSTKEPPGPDWTTLTWDTFTLVPGVPQNSVAGQGSGPGAFGGITLNSGLANAKISPVHGGGVTYTGGGVTANIQLVVTDWNVLADVMTFRVMHSVLGQIGGLGAITGPGTYNFNFTVPASVGANITVDDASPGNVLAGVQANQYAGVPIKLTFTLQIFNL